MGSVYEATDVKLQRVVAVKLLGGRGFDDVEAQRRFSREARATARLEAPNIVRLYDHGALGTGAAYLVMERLVGVTWRVELDARGRFDPGFAAEALEQACRGVEAAHAAGILHRDLKPENLFLVRESGSREVLVKVLDFGLARFREKSSFEGSTLTRAGSVFGTIGYMSPEQARGGPVSEVADVYSIGVLVLETLLGRQSFLPNAFHYQNLDTVRTRVPATYAGAGGEALAVTLERALALEAERRFPSVSALREVLIPVIRRCDAPPR